ncbi:hypothetical protein X466_05165 [Oenococcus oeni S25]|uniref:CdaR family protein n=1 Tax=Oenococcus oeni TaxID=1247 RepID=UPI00050FD205|nr:CdaR family protein [Oenococcus oeni]KGH70047.1 hypothetical protein X466_05165 [Oenococcus oeni S25]KGH79796.1 hypothetical protein X281_07285 [Oenococcus oeni IOEB_0607]KGH88802.1 hypothetical protein X296_08590 [Oenococcus oeni IOEB_L26_1]KMQ38558.1 hypothetical protein AAX20_04135 [Oenococcus oeni]OIK60524.1 hypothetical protein ATW63_08205 [Oenococcus oeni]
MRYINSLLRKKWFQLLVTLILAIVLFAYVTGTTGTVRSSKSQQNELITTQTTEINVPVNVNMNENKYYVSGVPQTIKVKITGPSGLITAAQNSQTIRATVNLEKPKIGSQNVSLKLTGLSDTLAKTLDPSSLIVNVSRKISKSVPIIPTYNRDNIASKYVVSGFKISQTKATVTGPSDLVKVVNHISTSLNVPANTQSSINKNIALKAVDKNGSVVSVEINPSSVAAKLDVTSEFAVKNSSKETKTVSLNPKFTGSKSMSNYNVTLSSSSVQITGDKSSVDKIDSVPVTVDMNQISTSGGVITVKPSLPKGIDEITPKAVEISITARTITGSSSNKSSSSSSEGK